LGFLGGMMCSACFVLITAERATQAAITFRSP
jgi:hypothetical protein